jgi:hypothetical protein
MFNYEYHLEKIAKNYLIKKQPFTENREILSINNFMFVLLFSLIEITNI